GRYLRGGTAVAVAALLLSLVLPPPDRSGVRLALGAALVVQGPIGWWLVRAVGTERFHLVWVIGIATRLGVVAVCGLVLGPALGLALARTLLAVVGLLMSPGVVEAVVGRPGSRVGRGPG